MNYSLEKVSTVQACDTLLASAQKQKENLERKKRNLGESIASFSERIDHIGKELASVQLLLDTFMTAYDTLPEGSINRVNIHVEVKRLEVRKAYLDKTAITCNIHSLLAKQVLYNRLSSQVSLMDTYISAVQNKRVALIDAVLRVSNVKAQPRTGRTPLQAACSSRTPVSPQKLQSKKRSYNPRMLFSGLPFVHAKQQLEKRVYSSRACLSLLHLKPAVMYWIQILRKKLELRWQKSVHYLRNQFSPSASEEKCAISMPGVLNPR